MVCPTTRYLCIFVLTMNLLLDATVETSRLDCSRFVFARKCRGISAKRSDVMPTDARKVKPAAAAEAMEDASEAVTPSVAGSTRRQQMLLIPRLRYFASSPNHSLFRSATVKRHRLPRVIAAAAPGASGSSQGAGYTRVRNEDGQTHWNFVQDRPWSSPQFRDLAVRRLNFGQKGFRT